MTKRLTYLGIRRPADTIQLLSTLITDDAPAHPMKRCVWAAEEPNTTYHDKEWGRPEHDDQRLFEFLILEGAQAGLSWVTILKRRKGYKRAFPDARTVSRYTERDIQRLLGDASIIRNRLKVTSAVNNARQFLKVQKEFGSFDKYLWAFVEHRPILNQFRKHSEIPVTTEISERLSRDLKDRGFTFVGPVICYALMQATGMVNDHTSGCFLHQR